MEVTKGQVDSFLGPHQTELIETTSTPQEEEGPRIQVPRICRHETTPAMNEAVEMHPSELVFNLEDAGISEWEDRKSKRVVVPMIANG
jgi:hypothetical protein